jgi:NAD(P)H-dependent flavin oxidoreductase YrpB (nitropropane dioxygenase family)
MVAQSASYFVYVYEVSRMGTRFVSTREAPIHERMMQLGGSERDTSLVFRTMHNPAHF